MIELILVGRGALTPPIAAMDRPPEKDGKLIAFTAIAQGSISGGRHVMPYLRLARTELQRAELEKRLNSRDQARLYTVDLLQSVIIAGFQGLQPTSGYRIEILALEPSGRILNVTVKQSSPAPAELVRPGFESPYHVIQIARNEFEKLQISNYRLMGISGEALMEGPLEGLA
jgi:hypothetical protein